MAKRIGRKATPLHVKVPRDVDDWLCQKCGQVKIGESTWVASGSVLAANLGCIGNVCPACLTPSQAKAITSHANTRLKDPAKDFDSCDTTPHPEAAEQGLSIGPNGGLTIAPVPKATTLVHDDRRQYDFRPQPDGETVNVHQQCGADVRMYPLPTEEARLLYRRLQKQGFKAW